MGVRPLLGALVQLLDDDDFFACLAALQDDGNLAGRSKFWEDESGHREIFTLPGLYTADNVSSLCKQRSGDSPLGILRTVLRAENFWLCRRARALEMSQALGVRRQGLDLCAKWLTSRR